MPTSKKKGTNKKEANKPTSNPTSDSTQNVNPSFCDWLIGLNVVKIGLVVLLGYLLQYSVYTLVLPSSTEPQSIHHVLLGTELELSSFLNDSIGEESMFDEKHYKDLLWGPYKKDVHFGISSRSEVDRVISGFLWGTFIEKGKLKNTMKETDHLVNSTWIRNDGTSYAHKIIHDNQLHLVFNVWLWKGLAGDWVVRIEANSTQPGLSQTISLLPYVGIEDKHSGTLSISRESGVVGGYTPSTRHFALLCSTDDTLMNQRSYGIIFNDTASIEDHLISLQQSPLKNDLQPNSNMFLFEHVLATPFKIDIIYMPSSMDNTTSEVLSRATSLTNSMTQNLENSESLFISKFREVFPMRSYYNTTQNEEYQRICLSNYIGSIYYLSNKEPHTGEYKSIFSSSFPRDPKAAWGEGFNQLLLSKWNRRLSLDVMTSWLMWIDKEGYQLHAGETGIVNAFPFYYSLLSLLNNDRPTPEERRFYKFTLRRVVSHFQSWYNKYQGNRDNSWNWKSTPQNTTEHLNLLCWMAFASSTIHKLTTRASVYGVRGYRLIEIILKNRIKDFHWDEKQSGYADVDALTGEFKLEPFNDLVPLIYGYVPLNSKRLNHTLDRLENGMEQLFELDPNGQLSYLLMSSLHYNYISEGTFKQRAHQIYKTIKLKYHTNPFSCSNNPLFILIQNELFI